MWLKSEETYHHQHHNIKPFITQAFTTAYLAFVSSLAILHKAGTPVKKYTWCYFNWSLLKKIQTDLRCRQYPGKRSMSSRPKCTWTLSYFPSDATTSICASHRSTLLWTPNWSTVADTMQQIRGFEHILAYISSTSVRTFSCLLVQLRDSQPGTKHEMIIRRVPIARVWYGVNQACHPPC